MDANELSLVELAERLGRRELSAEETTRACLDRISAREEAVHAWIHLDAEAALAQARTLDAGPPKGPLHGVPVAIKDIFDTVDMPTGYGSPIYDGHRPAGDAATVALMREAGAVILGKTVTTEFAYFQPGATGNPHNPAHTPGGSSSGSAAAVADFMVPLGFGSQTAASVTRPAAYCGTVGFKSALGRFSLAGVKPLAHSLDSLGWMTRDSADAAYVHSVLTDRAAPARAPDLSAPPRIAICRTPVWDAAEPPMREALDRAAGRLANAGAAVEELALPAPFEELTDAHKTVMAHEAVRALAWERTARRDGLSDAIQQLLDGGLAIGYGDYCAALAVAATARDAFARLSETWDAVLAPAAPGEAPAGLSATGDPIFSRMWSVMGVPSIALPAGKGPLGLPLGLQLLAPASAEKRLFDIAHWIEPHLA